jgi:hypothetical protein
MSFLSELGWMWWGCVCTMPLLLIVLGGPPDHRYWSEETEVRKFSSPQRAQREIPYERTAREVQRISLTGVARSIDSSAL